MRKYIQSYRKHINPPYSKNDYPVILASLFALLLIPVIVLFLSKASVFFSHAQTVASTEAESGVLSGNATIQQDPTASGGQYLHLSKSAIGQTGTPSPTVQPTAGNIQVNFTTPLRTVDPLAFGIDESGYGSSVLATDTTEQQRFKTLGVTQIRMDLKYTTSGDPTSKIVCSGSGCVAGPTGDQWVTAIKAIGAQPIVIVPTNTTDAANLVKHFNVDTNNRVNRWIVGNEQGTTATDTANIFNNVYDAMKAVDPTIKVGGPASAFFNCCGSSTELYIFLSIAGGRADFLDFHKYGQGGSVTKNDTDLMAMTQEYEDNINSLRSLIQTLQPSRANQIDIEVGEWQLDWDQQDPRFETNFNSVWGASSLGHIIKAGALALPYSTKNNDLGFVFENNNSTLGTSINDPMPIYHGYGMFTGEGLFRKFGTTMVSTTTTLPNIEVYASDNNKNIVVINKDAGATQNATIGLGGYTQGTADIWRKDGSQNAFAAPTHVGTVSISNGSFQYSFPPYSVTTFVLN